MAEAGMAVSAADIDGVSDTVGVVDAMALTDGGMDAVCDGNKEFNCDGIMVVDAGHDMLAVADHAVFPVVDCDVAGDAKPKKLEDTLATAV